MQIINEERRKSFVFSKDRFSTFGEFITYLNHQLVQIFPESLSIVDPRILTVPRWRLQLTNLKYDKEFIYTSYTLYRVA